MTFTTGLMRVWALPMLVKHSATGSMSMELSVSQPPGDSVNLCLLVSGFGNGYGDMPFLIKSVTKSKTEVGRAL